MTRDGDREGECSPAGRVVDGLPRETGHARARRLPRAVDSQMLPRISPGRFPQGQPARGLGQDPRLNPAFQMRPKRNGAGPV